MELNKGMIYTTLDLLLEHALRTLYLISASNMERIELINVRHRIALILLMN